MECLNNIFMFNNACKSKRLCFPKQTGQKTGAASSKLTPAWKALSSPCIVYRPCILSPINYPMCLLVEIKVLWLCFLYNANDASVRAFPCNRRLYTKGVSSLERLIITQEQSEYRDNERKCAQAILKGTDRKKRYHPSSVRLSNNKYQETISNAFIYN